MQAADRYIEARRALDLIENAALMGQAVTVSGYLRPQPGGGVAFLRARKAVEGIRTGGGVPQIFGAPTASDGIMMGHQGMRYSLVSREVIADSIEVVSAGMNHDGVIAFGGGSPLDVGKTIAFMLPQTRPLWDFEDIGDWWTRANPAGIYPSIAVPTTAGTGSEATRFTIITDEATEMPRCFSISIQSDVAWREALRPFTAPAMWMAPENSSSFSVSVVLPASGCEMMAKVRRRRTSSSAVVMVAIKGKRSCIIPTRPSESRKT